MTQIIEPTLAPPGAGLPAPELFVARIFFTWRRWKATRERSNAEFQEERAAIAEMTRGCDAEVGARRVLIDRLRGMEDSSRHWSVWMTLEHLRLVHSGIIHVIASLAKGTIPAIKASTAAVKPSPQVTAEVVSEYEKSCDTLLATVADTPNLGTREKHAHPWFGPLDAAGWHAIAAMHIGIHRRQIELIFAGLAGTGN